MCEETQPLICGHCCCFTLPSNFGACCTCSYNNEPINPNDPVCSNYPVLNNLEDPPE